MEDKVIELLKKLKSKKSLSLEEIAERLEINDKEGLLELKEILTKKVKDNTLYKNDSGSYKHLSKTSLRKGTFHSNKSGGGKVLVATTYEKMENNVLSKKSIVLNLRMLMELLIMTRY